MPSIYITSQIPQIGIDLLLKRHLIVEVNKSGRNLSAEGLKKVVGDYDAILTILTDKIDEDVIGHSSKKLKIISNFAVGFDNINVAVANKRGITVTNTPGVASESVAEHTFAMILSLNKMLTSQDKYVRQGKFVKWEPDLFLSHQIWRQIIGIIGLGRIGTFVAQMAYGGFRMDILYHDIKRSEDLEILTEAKYATVHEICKTADIITLHVPLNESTRHLVGKDEFKLMKETAIIVNTARGPVIDEDALIWALREKKIAGAALDVFEHEPDIARELMQNNRVLFSPHTASATFETRNEMSRIAAQNIIDVLEGREPVGLIRQH